MDLRLAATLYMGLSSLFAVFIWRWYSHEKNMAGVAEQGVQTEAEVIKSSMESMGRGYVFYVMYRFAVSLPDGQTSFYTKRQNISETHHRHLGARVQVKYVPSNPRISRLAGADVDEVTLKSAKIFVFMSALCWLIGLIFTIAFYWGIR